MSLYAPSTNIAIPSISEHQLETVTLRLLDINAVIRSNSATFLARLRDSYADFIVAENSIGTEQRIECSLFIRGDTQWGEPGLFIDNEQFFVPDSETLPDELLISIVIAKLLHRTRTHHLFHAGVVAHGNQAIVIAAHSNHGKSTLVYELIRRGLHFYSDDLAPVGIHDGRVYPFPRTLQLRPEAREFVELDPSQYLVSTWKNKYLFRQMGSSPVKLDEGATIRAVVFLRDPTKLPMQISESIEREIFVVLERLSDELLQTIRQLPEIVRLEANNIGGYPVLKFVTHNNSQLLHKIEELCRAVECAILYAAKSVPERPSFDNVPSLDPMSRSQATLELLHHWQSGTESVLVKEVLGATSPIRLYTQIAGILRSANCYYLNVGPLHDMAELVMPLVADKQI